MKDPPDLPGPSFPRVMRRVWRVSDPATRCNRVCDALGEPTPHQRFETHTGPYWVCSQTGQLTRDAFPTPTDLVEHYDDRWTGRIDPDQQAKDDAAVARWARWLKKFDPWRGEGRLFEVGSGKGELLKAAVDQGWSAEGNELSPVAAQHAESFAGAPVHVGPIEDITLDAQRYDVVLLNNVFEHLRRPSDVMHNLAQSLRPGGVLFVQTLCAQSLSLKVNPNGWSYFGTGHLFVPTLVSMEAYCERVGLNPIEIKTHGFRSAAGGVHHGSKGLRRRYDKLLASIAGRTNRGHRVEAVLQRV